MNGWQLSLLIGALAVMALSTRIDRAALWIFAGGASFVASAAYENSGLPFPPFFAMMCDAVVCLAIYFWAQKRWEIWLFRIFQASVLVNLFYLAGAIGPHYWYIAALEALNWFALFVIGATAMLQRTEKGYGRGPSVYRRLRLSRAARVVFSPRSDNPFHWT